MGQYLKLAREARAIDQTTTDPTDLVVPVEALTDLERHVVEVGRQARPDGSFPVAMRLETQPRQEIDGDDATEP